MTLQGQSCFRPQRSSKMTPLSRNIHRQVLTQHLLARSRQQIWRLKQMRHRQSLLEARRTNLTTQTFTTQNAAIKRIRPDMVHAHILTSNQRESVLARVRSNHSRRRSRTKASDNSSSIHNNTVVSHLLTRRQFRNQGCAFAFHESMGYHRLTLPSPVSCSFCGAFLIGHESSYTCCLNGEIDLPPIPEPPELIELYQDETSLGRHFRQHIRVYNHVFSFTSIGVHIDEDLIAGRQGMFTFRAQGTIYHRIGNLLPQENRRPRYLQTYIYDTEHETENRLLESNVLDRYLLEKLKRILDMYNPFVNVFRHLAHRPDIQNCRLIIKEQPLNRPQYCLPTASQVAGIIVGGEQAGELNARDIIVETTSGQLRHVQDYAGYYDPLQYPLLFPYGTYGWDINTRSSKGKKISCCDYYSYMLQCRGDNHSLLLRGGRLLQQYIVDNYVKIESHKLHWIRDNQDTIRAEFYQGLQDSLITGEKNADNIGRRTILPSSFVGSPRDMYQRYQDAMALVQKFGKPDLFITVTCNPNWDEIHQQLFPGQTPHDRPELLSRVFHTKLEELKRDIIQNGVLGRVIVHVHVIEFQKRGLPHAHMLFVLHEDDSPKLPEEYDYIVRAEIPDSNEEPDLYEAVLKHMIHGPCGLQYPNSPCMKDGICKRGYPKAFASYTRQGDDSYPIYQRRDTGPVLLQSRSGIQVDNRWVVPYNPWLLLKYDCHVNVEICSSIKSVKYLYKYIHKGPDRISMEVCSDSHDEIRQFIDARWICAPEAAWKIFKFLMSRMYPFVERLQIHLPNMQQVHFNTHEQLSDILLNENYSKTMLTEYFETCSIDANAIQYLYREFPEHYRWVSSQRKWQRRIKNIRVIGRIYAVSPSEGERYYLRILLNHVRGPTSFQYLLSVNNILYSTFKEAAEKRGLLENDDSIRQCLQEAFLFKMPSSLRRLFVTLLVHCQPTGVRELWNEFYSYMVEDYPSSSTGSNIFTMNMLLGELNRMLEHHGKHVSDYDLPGMSEGYDYVSGLPKIIEDELSVPIPQEDIDAIQCLNNDQRNAYNSIMATIGQRQNAVYFVDGPGGTGKTYLYRAILASLRKDGFIALATATSGIAATLLPGGRTAHSRFKIPINLDASSTCLISKQSDLADLIRRASAIIWDEAPMCHRFAIEALDRTLKDIMNVDLTFGGKVIIFGGDFRQILPVVPKGTKSEMLDACFVKSDIWSNVQVLKLQQNMRSKNDPAFSAFLLNVGEGRLQDTDDAMIKLPAQMVIPWENNESIDNLIDVVFRDLSHYQNNTSYIVERAIITTTNEEVDVLNDKIISKLQGTEFCYNSFDTVEDDERNLYQQEFLNSISPGGLPGHVLTLKIGAPIILLRNLEPKVGLCNGTRLLCRDFSQNLIDAEILTGHHVGTRVFLPRIPMKTAENLNLPFIMTRKQFPVKLSFAITINKSQGQTIPNVGIYLPDNVFSHGQLYVALSRGVSEDTTKILVRKGILDGEDGVFTKNVVHKEVLLHIQRSDVD